MTSPHRARLAVSRRGYLLAEVAIGGAVLAVALGFALSLLAQGRTDVSAASHRATAASLARGKLDEIASNTSCTGSFVSTPVGASFPGFRWSAVVTTAAVGASSSPPIAATMCEAIVTISFDVPIGTHFDVLDGTRDGKCTQSLQRMWAP